MFMILRYWSAYGTEGGGKDCSLRRVFWNRGGIPTESLAGGNDPRQDDRRLADGCALFLLAS